MNGLKLVCLVIVFIWNLWIQEKKGAHPDRRKLQRIQRQMESSERKKEALKYGIRDIKKFKRIKVDTIIIPLLCEQHLEAQTEKMTLPECHSQHVKILS